MTAWFKKLTSGYTTYIGMIVIGAAGILQVYGVIDEKFVEAAYWFGGTVCGVGIRRAAKKGGA